MTHDDDAEPTQPVPAGDPGSPAPDAGQHRADGPGPAGQPAPESSQPGQLGEAEAGGAARWHDYGVLHTQPMPAPPLSAKRPSGKKLWIAVAALSLVVGVVSGVVGSAVFDVADDGNVEVGPYEGGLDDVDTVRAPPVKDGGVAAVAKAVLPSTVQISAEYGGQAGAATGSGFVLDEQGHVVTNNHVIESAAQDDGPIEVVDQDGNRYQADLVGRSAVYDLAVLQVSDDADLEPAALGSTRQLRVGDGVVAFGSPLGLNATVTSGIVSALDRPVSTGDSADDTSFINAVQTDAAINPGNSGGPLTNLRGQVVGVNSAIATSGGGTVSGEAGNIGVGFAIPIEQVEVTADQILKTGKALYPVIGADVATGEQGGDGAQIQSVDPDTPASDAGLESGDVVTEVDGQRVFDGIGLIVSIRSHQPGEDVDFTYERGGQEQTTTLTLDSKTG